MRAKRRKASCLQCSSRVMCTQFSKCDPSPGLQIQCRVPESVALLHPKPVAIQLQYKGNSGESHIRHRSAKLSMSLSGGIPGVPSQRSAFLAFCWNSSYEQVVGSSATASGDRAQMEPGIEQGRHGQCTINRLHRLYAGVIK